MSRAVTYLVSAMLSVYVALIMTRVTSASAISRCSRVHGCLSARRHADCEPGERREVSQLASREDSDSAKR